MIIFIYYLIIIHKMFNAVIPDCKKKFYDFEDNLNKQFYNKNCEVCGEECEWDKEDIKQYFRCCHYNCPLLFQYMNHCIN